MTPALPDSAPPIPAGLGRRLGAMFYDSLLLFAVTWAFTALAIGARVVLQGSATVRATGHAAVSGPLLQLSLLVLVVVFFGWFWTRSGQTLGMQAWRLRVETLEGGRLDWRRSLLRLALAAVSAACLGAGYWSLLFDRERRTWHDRVSASRVVVLPPTSGRAPVEPRV
jgi:uncharacterized RDD family membrane protein YckC